MKFKQNIIALIANFCFCNFSHAHLVLPPDTSEIIQKLQAMAAGKLPFDSSLKLIPGIIKDAEQIKFKKGIASAYLTQGIALYRTGKFSEAIQSYEKSVTYRDTIKEFKETSRTYNNMALAYADLSQYDKALNSHNRALKIRKQNRDTAGVAASIMNIGLLLELQGKYDESQSSYFESLKIRESIHDSDGIASCLNNIGTSFFYLNNPQKAIEYYSKSSEISVKRKNLIDMGKSFGNLAMAYDHIKKYDLALDYYSKATDIFISLNNPFNLATCYNNIALVYNNLQQREKAIEYHLKSLEIKKQIGDRAGEATSSLNLGNLYIDIKSPSKALPYFENGLTLSLSLRNRVLIMNAYKGLAEFYRLSGDYKKCFTNYQLYEMNKDSLNNLEKLAKISELEGLYNTEKAQKQLLQKDAELNEQLMESAKNKNRLMIALGCLLVIISGAALLFMLYRKIKVLNKNLQQKIHENDLLMKEINHRIKNNLQLVSSLLKLPQKEISAENAKEIMSDTRNRVNAIGIIHKSLYRDNAESTVDMAVFLKELSNSIVNNLSEKKVSIKEDFDEINLDVDTAVPLGLIANELITNAIKHAYGEVTNPEIFIRLKSNSSKIELTVNDNGQKDETKNVSAKSKSFGIKMIYALAEQLGAEFHANYSNGMCFSFIFTKSS